MGKCREEKLDKKKIDNSFKGRFYWQVSVNAEGLNLKGHPQLARNLTPAVQCLSVFLGDSRSVDFSYFLLLCLICMANSYSPSTSHVGISACVNSSDGVNHSARYICFSYNHIVLLSFIPHQGRDFMKTSVVTCRVPSARNRVCLGLNNIQLTLVE